ncbi:Fur-regulated basic protein FbpA [Sutcliffiella horikoshii]|uniref:Fur-regulated basic protein FbpA n=1 Tax=Sutcliffiella horikoshii TaxID=79883 RepID=UPI00203A3D0A|nr:Fur-regulated basic protein FbpA [Sutcliffiella horikoshii]MCM3620481.1 Fur-regulated basic protein FbpA [Sutcliffiella horikoshii]
MSTLLRKKRQERRDYLMHQLKRHGVSKSYDGIDLKTINLSELERIHIKVKCDFGKELSKEENK